MRLKKKLYSLAIVISMMQFSACNASDSAQDMPTSIPSEITPAVGSTETLPTEIPATPTPTPAPVEDNYSDELPVPLFSKAGGFYDKAFLLSLSSKTGTEIYYTLDGTDPRTSGTASLYAEEIKIYNNTNEPNKYSAITDISLEEYTPPKYNIDKGMTIRATVKLSVMALYVFGSFGLLYILISSA